MNMAFITVKMTAGTMVQTLAKSAIVVNPDDGCVVMMARISLMQVISMLKVSYRFIFHLCFIFWFLTVSFDMTIRVAAIEPLCMIHVISVVGTVSVLPFASM